MTSGEIIENIRYNENLLDQYYMEKRRIEKELDELDRLKQKFSLLQNNFGRRQEERRQKLSSYSQRTIRNKIHSTYCTGMQDLLSGSLFNNAYEGLSTAKQRAIYKIQELLEKLNDCEEHIVYRESRKGYWQSQLRQALAKELKEEV